METLIVVYSIVHLCTILIMFGSSTVYNKNVLPENRLNIFSLCVISLISPILFLILIGQSLESLVQKGK